MNKEFYCPIYGRTKIRMFRHSFIDMCTKYQLKKVEGVGRTYDGYNPVITDSSIILHSCICPVGKSISQGKPFYPPENVEFFQMVNGELVPEQQHARAKLDEVKVVKIKEMLRKKVPISHIAREFDVSNRTIRHIRNGTSWKHVGEDMSKRLKKYRETMGEMKDAIRKANRRKAKTKTQLKVEPKVEPREDTDHKTPWPEMIAEQELGKPAKYAVGDKLTTHDEVSFRVSKIERDEQRGYLYSGQRLRKDGYDYARVYIVEFPQREIRGYMEVKQ